MSPPFDKGGQGGLGDENRRRNLISKKAAGVAGRNNLSPVIVTFISSLGLETGRLDETD